MGPIQLLHSNSPEDGPGSRILNTDKSSINQVEYKAKGSVRVAHRMVQPQTPVKPRAAVEGGKGGLPPFPPSTAARGFTGVCGCTIRCATRTLPLALYKDGWCSHRPR
jgi:hypothetical protein